MTRPYVYKRAEDLGLPMIDATNPVRITVTDADVIKAKKANSEHCALARAACRVPGVVAAYVFRSTAFLETRESMTRYALPSSVQKEIVSFDRAKVFASGVYQLSSVPPANTRKSLDKKNKKKRQARRKSATLVKTEGGFAKAIDAMLDSHAGRRSITGVRNDDIHDPLPDKAPSRYVHRTQYIRSFRDPDK